MTKSKKPRKARAAAGPATLPGELTGATLNGFPIRRVRAGDLLGAEYNPRKLSKTARAGLTASVTSFGLVEPIVWNRRTQRIVGGHARHSTLDPDAVTDVVEVDLDEPREKALALALNNRHIAGDWTEALGDLLREVDAELPDLSLELNFGDLLGDVPASTNPDELLDELEGADKGQKTDTPDLSPEGEGAPQNKLHQVVLVYSAEEHELVMRLIERVQKKHGLDTGSAAVLHALKIVAK